MKLLVERKLKGVEACGRSALVGRGVVVVVVVVVVDVVAPRSVHVQSALAVSFPDWHRFLADTGRMILLV